MSGETKSTGRNWLMALFILVVFLMVSSYLLVLLMGYGFMFFSPGGLTVSAQVFPAPVYLFFFVFGFAFPALGGFMFISVFAVYVICFIAAWKWRESFHRVIANVFSRPFRRLFSNFLFIMPLLSSMALTAVLAIIYAQDFVGIPTGQVNFPSGTPLQEEFLSIGYAPVVEELGFRLIPIGLFVVFYVFLTGKNVGQGSSLKRLLASFFYPEGAKRMSGLPNVSDHGIRHGISTGEWTMIGVTTFVFAIAHVISGIGWEIGKITSVLVQGFFFALTYVIYGFEAPILMHWFFNYYSFFFDSNLLSSFFPGTEPVLSVIDLLVVVLGVAGWVIFAVYGLRWLNKRRKGEPSEPMSAPPRPPLTLPS